MANTLTKTQLNEFKEQLFKEEQRILSTIEKLKANDPFQDPDHVTDNAAVDTDVREQMDHDTIEAETKELDKELLLVREAVRKIEKDKYGTCERCKKPIPLARLKFMPYGKYCVDCENHLVK